MAYKRSVIVAQAQSWLGCKESDGSHKKIIDVYNSHTPLARGYKVTYTDAWCATFVSAVAIKVGYTAIIPTECGCEAMIALFKKLGCWMETDSHVPSAGDVIFYDWDDSGSGDCTGGADHVGYVEKVSGTTITVIEGNYSDSVKRRTIAVNARYIRGYGLPKYDDSTSTSTEETSGGSSSGTTTGTTHKVVKGDTLSALTKKYGTTVTAIVNANKSKYSKITANYIVVGWELTIPETGTSSGGSSSGTSGSTAPSYKVGTTYTTQVDSLNVRTGAGTGNSKVSYANLTANAKANAYSNGSLKKGTKVTCKAVKTVGKDIWMQIPSGWIAAYYDGEVYVK